MSLNASHSAVVAHLAKDLADLGRRHKIAFRSNDGISRAIARFVSYPGR